MSHKTAQTAGDKPLSEAEILGWKTQSHQNVNGTRMGHGFFSLLPWRLVHSRLFLRLFTPIGCDVISTWSEVD